MLLAVTAVNVILNGCLLVSSQPAKVNGGVVFAPIDPFARRLADRIDVDMAHRSVRIARGERSITLPIAPYVREEEIVIPLAMVARALGGEITFEGWRATLAIVIPSPTPLATMTPYAPPSPMPSPEATFTPTPIPTPLPTVIGTPQPRRTPISAPARFCCVEPPR
jgi:hypothetical protein